MTEPNGGGWMANVERDHLSFGVRILLGHRSDDGTRYLTGEAGGRQTRADLMHERGRVDRLITTLSTIAERPGDLGSGHD